MTLTSDLRAQLSGIVEDAELLADLVRQQGLPSKVQREAFLVLRQAGARLDRLIDRLEGALLDAGKRVRVPASRRRKRRKRDIYYGKQYRD